VRLLATNLDVPMAMVNLLDEDRDWFKASVGLPLSESPVNTSFCEAFFKTSDAVIIVEDTITAPGLATHPLVVGPPFIRFYAAARLAVAGHTLGTLCAYDVRPRTISETQIEQLQTLAAAAVDLMLRRTLPTP